MTVGTVTPCADATPGATSASATSVASPAMCVLPPRIACTTSEIPESSAAPTRLLAYVHVRNTHGLPRLHHHSSQARWRRRRASSLQVVGAVVHEPRHAARHDQLGHADHRPARPRAQPRHFAAPARVGDPRLHDRLHRAGAHGGTAGGTLWAPEGLPRGGPGI